eukprot:1157049-Pelagomonas_calceolata.AAC.7
MWSEFGKECGCLAVGGCVGLKQAEQDAAGERMCMHSQKKRHTSICVFMVTSLSKLGKSYVHVWREGWVRERRRWMSKYGACGASRAGQAASKAGKGGAGQDAGGACRCRCKCRWWMHAFQRVLMPIKMRAIMDSADANQGVCYTKQC